MNDKGLWNNKACIDVSCYINCINFNNKQRMSFRYIFREKQQSKPVKTSHYSLKFKAPIMKWLYLSFLQHLISSWTRPSHGPEESTGSNRWEYETSKSKMPSNLTILWGLKTAPVGSRQINQGPSDCFQNSSGLFFKNWQVATLSLLCPVLQEIIKYNWSWSRQGAEIPKG